MLTGRAKDTIVLTNGENIEPQPIEDACARSPYIDQIMLVGQDRKFLGALIVPNTEALAAWAKQRSQAEPWERGVGAIDMESKAVEDLIRQELAREVKNRFWPHPLAIGKPSLCGNSNFRLRGRYQTDLLLSRWRQNPLVPRLCLGTRECKTW